MTINEVLEKLKRLGEEDWDGPGNVLHYYVTKIQEDIPEDYLSREID